MSRTRRIAVVVPLLNEARRVEGLVEDVAGQDYDGEVDVLVADGGSDDGTIELLTAAARRNGLRLEVVPNPERLVPPGLNACIPRADADLIVRLDAKARYPSDYLRRLADAADETRAWNVGGLADPVGTTPTERAAACAMASPFGGIGWLREASSQERVDVDTVYCGAFRPEAFRRVGLFDVAMAGAHDDEFNLRLRKAGGRVVFDPAIRAPYTPAGSYRELLGKYYVYGRDKVLVLEKHGELPGVRSLVPAAFVASLGGLALAGARSPLARRLVVLEAAAWAVGAVGFAAAGVRARREPWSLAPRVVAAFATFHVGYGAGFLRGLVRR